MPPPPKKSLNPDSVHHQKPCKQQRNQSQQFFNHINFLPSLKFSQQPNKAEFKKKKKGEDSPNLESDGLIGLAIVAVDGAVTRSLRRDVAESNRPRPSGRTALVERRIVIAISTHSGSQSRYPNPIPPTHILFFSFRSDIFLI